MRASASSKMTTLKLTQINKVNATMYVRLRCCWARSVLGGVAGTGVDSNGECSSISGFEAGLCKFSSSATIISISSGDTYCLLEERYFVDVRKFMEPDSSKGSLKRPTSTRITELQSARDQQNPERKRHDASLRPCLSFAD